MVLVSLNDEGRVLGGVLVPTVAYLRDDRLTSGLLADDSVDSRHRHSDALVLVQSGDGCCGLTLADVLLQYVEALLRAQWLVVVAHLLALLAWSWCCVGVGVSGIVGIGLLRLLFLARWDVGQRHSSENGSGRGGR